MRTILNRFSFCLRLGVKISIPGILQSYYYHHTFTPAVSEDEANETLSDALSDVDTITAPKPHDQSDDENDDNIVDAAHDQTAQNNGHQADPSLPLAYDYSEWVPVTEQKIL